MKLDLKQKPSTGPDFYMNCTWANNLTLILKLNIPIEKHLKLSLDLTVSLNLKIGPEQKLHFKPDLKYQEPTTASESTYIEFITRHEESKYPKIGPKNKSYT